MNTNGPVQIVADIGGTNARFAYLDSTSQELLGVRVFLCADFPNALSAIQAYLKSIGMSRVEKICLAVAAPTRTDFVDFPNNHWSFSCAQLAASLATPVKVINDFTAQMLCVASLCDSQLMWLGVARPLDGTVKALVGPGTGLGVSALLPSGQIVPSEGGHVAFAPLNDHQLALQKELFKRYSRVSVERVLSGEGLSNLYWANSVLAGRDHELRAPEINSGGQQGDTLCLKAITDFWSILAAVAGDVALTMGATGGMYISGGVPEKLLWSLDEKMFRQQFNSKGRYSHMCAAMPLAFLQVDYPGLRGSVAALRSHETGGLTTSLGCH